MIKDMHYRFCGNSGLQLPLISLGLWHHFGDTDDFSIAKDIVVIHGDGIYAGEGVFINFGAVILDGAKVTIGKKTLIAPGVHIYTAQHPLDAAEREMHENCLPVTIGEHCRIGGQGNDLSLARRRLQPSS
jgi:acetyltransferase-like isoleucine patch superfamily enzyme